jgi:hypothetical protein
MVESTMTVSATGRSRYPPPGQRSKSVSQSRQLLASASENTDRKHTVTGSIRGFLLVGTSGVFSASSGCFRLSI